MTRALCLAALALCAFGCGGGDPCAGSRCPGDARPTAAQYDQCVKQHQADRNKACARESLNYELCVQASAVCTASGTTDASATLSRASTDCKAALEAVTCCALGGFGFSCK